MIIQKEFVYDEMNNEIINFYSCNYLILGYAKNVLNTSVDYFGVFSLYKFHRVKSRQFLLDESYKVIKFNNKTITYF